MPSPLPPAGLSLSSSTGSSGGSGSRGGGNVSCGGDVTPSQLLVSTQSLPLDDQHHVGQSAGFLSMRAGLEATFALAHASPYLGRLTGAGSAPEQHWLSYGAVGSLVRATAALLDALALSCECGGGAAAVPPGASRPFVAIGGPNSVEWVTTDLAASGAFLPTVGLHPEWPLVNLAGALDLTWAPVLVLTSAALLPAIAAVEALCRAHPLRHIVLLDPGWVLGSAAAGEAVAAAAGELQARGVALWPARPMPEAAPSPAVHPDLATVPAAALHALAAAALAAVPAARSAQARKWQALLQQAQQSSSSSSSTGSTSASSSASGPLRVFIEPDQAWLGAAAAAEAAREAEARERPLAGSGPVDPLERPGPLYHPLAIPADVDTARTALAREGQGGGGVGGGWRGRGPGGCL